MKDLRQITVIGLGLLGGSITLTISRCFDSVKAVGYSHRPSTRRKARQSAIATEIVDDIKLSVTDADIVILATPILTFEEIFSTISDALPVGCIVTDVGSTKVLAHRWAAKELPKGVHYVGSHPIAGSEQRGLEYARDDLFDEAVCILTATKKTNRGALQVLKRFWSTIGCTVKVMTPGMHDKMLAKVSHLPHIAAAALINSNDEKELKFAGKGLIDSSRIASGPANIWADVLLTNKNNAVRCIDKLTAELQKIKNAIKNQDKRQIEKLLTKARDKRSSLIRNKIKNKELM